MASAASASDADFKLKNSTGYTIDQVFVSTSNNNDWGDNLMAGKSLDDGVTLNVTFGKTSACVFDLKVRYSDDKSTAVWSKLNLCKDEKITLYWDEKTQKTRAVEE